MADDRVIFDAQSARRIIAQTRAGEGRFRHEPQAEQGVVVPPSPIVQLVKVTSTTVDANGFYPGKWAYDNVPTVAVIDRDVIWVHFPNSETPALTTYYLARFAGVLAADGVGVYSVAHPAAAFDGTVAVLAAAQTLANGTQKIAWDTFPTDTKPYWDAANTRFGPTSGNLWRATAQVQLNYAGQAALATASLNFGIFHDGGFHTVMGLGITLPSVAGSIALFSHYIPPGNFNYIYPQVTVVVGGGATASLAGGGVWDNNSQFTMQRIG